MLKHSLISALLIATPLLTECGAPEPDVSTRQEAFAKCQAEISKAMPKIRRGSEGYSFATSDEYTERRVVQSYCQPTKHPKHGSLGNVVGFVEYLEMSKEWEEPSRLERTSIFYGVSFPWNT